jgi:hypothetical protein
MPERLSAGVRKMPAFLAPEVPALFPSMPIFSENCVPRRRVGARAAFPCSRFARSRHGASCEAADFRGADAPQRTKRKQSPMAQDYMPRCMGRIADGTTISDYHVSEKQRLLRHRQCIDHVRPRLPRRARPGTAHHPRRPPPFSLQAGLPSGTHALISATGTGRDRPVSAPDCPEGVP